MTPIIVQRVTAVPSQLSMRSESSEIEKGTLPIIVVLGLPSCGEGHKEKFERSPLASTVTQATHATHSDRNPNIFCNISNFFK
ncbi:MAG: hypothetical protein AB8B99_03940 [Phormidesmis sp.]